MTLSHAQRTTTSPGGVRGADGGQRGKSASRRMSDSVKGVNVEEPCPDVNGVEQLWKVPANVTSSSVEDCTKVRMSELVGWLVL